MKTNYRILLFNLIARYFFIFMAGYEAIKNKNYIAASMLLAMTLLIIMFSSIILITMKNDSKEK